MNRSELTTPRLRRQHVRGLILLMLILSLWGVPSSTHAQVIVDDSGKVGIGTTNPTQALDLTGASPQLRVSNKSNPNAYNAEIILSDQGVGGQGAKEFWLGLDTNDYFFVRDMTAAGQPHRFVIATDGKVGIGTTSPDSKVSIFQNASQDGLTIQNNANSINATLFGVTAPNDTTGQANLIYATSGGLPRFWVRTDGHVFMGPPNAGGKILSVFGDILVSGCLQNTDQTTTYAGNCSSDLRLKRNIVPLSHALDKLTALYPVHFEWKDELIQSKGTGIHYGLIAQDLEQVLPELVSQGPDGYKSVSYGSIEMQMLMIQAIKELKTANDRQQDEIEALKATLKTSP